MKTFTEELTVKLGFARWGGISKSRRKGRKRAIKAEGQGYANARRSKMIWTSWDTVRSSVWLRPSITE